MHISVDGSLANPHMAVAVFTWAAVIATLAAAATVQAHRRHRVTVTLLLLPTAGLAALTPWVQLRIAWLLQTASMGEKVSTTFFGPPPGWLAPAVGIAAGIAIGVVVSRGKRRVAAVHRA